MEEEAMPDNTVYLNDTSEFCRTVGGSSRTKAAFVQPDNPVMSGYPEPMEIEASYMNDRDRDVMDDKEEGKGGWSEVQFEAEPANLGSDEEDDGRPSGSRHRQHANGQRKHVWLIS